MKHILSGQMIGEMHRFSLRASEQCPVLADAETSEGGKSTVNAESLLCGFPGISLQIYSR